MFEDEGVEDLLIVVDLLLSDSDRFKQRAGAEFLAGLLRGTSQLIPLRSITIRHTRFRFETLAETAVHSIMVLDKHTFGPVFHSNQTGHYLILGESVCGEVSPKMSLLRSLNPN
jgi:hypothetical protein